MEANDSILKEIEKYSTHIDRFRARANTHGIWLFIATLGCWGVTEPSIRILAFVILFFIFLFLLHGSFPGEKRTFVYLLIVENKRKSVVVIIKTTFIFLACYGFYFISLFYFIQNWHSDKVTACI